MSAATPGTRNGSIAAPETFSISEDPMQPDHPRTLRMLRPFVPAKDFARCKQFYADLGFRVRPLGEGLAEMHLGPHAFLLQDYYVKEWRGILSCMRWSRTSTPGGRISSRWTLRRATGPRLRARRSANHG